MDQAAIIKSLRETLKGHINASPGTAQFKAQCIQKLETLSREQLEELLTKSVTESAQVIAQTQAALEDIRAQRHAEQALFDLQNGGPAKRQQAQQAQIDKDMGTLAQAVRETRTVGCTMANLQILVEAIGQNFSLEQAKAFIETNGSTMMSQPSRHEINAWKLADHKAAQAAEAQRIIMLKNMPHEQLREEVRQSGQQAQATAQQAEAQRQIQVREEREQGFPPLPQVDSNGVKIDSGYIIRLSNARIDSAEYKLFKHLCRRFGFSNVTKRLNGIS
jgi:hypothetical protein